MSGIHVFIIIAFMVTVAVMIAGEVSMARGGKFDQQHEGDFMSARVLMQLFTLGVAILGAVFW